jgi:tetratricopeptide (TPR) repeat protein
MQLGQAAHQAGLLDTALAAYTAAWDIDPRLATARLVLVLKDLERPDEAMQIYRRSLEQVGRYDSRIPGWNRGLARLYAEQERWIEAVSAYETALAAAGTDPAFEVESVYYEIAWAYRMAGRLAEAVEAIETAVALNPSGEVLLRAGQIYEAAGRPEAALASYRLALESLPESKPALEGVERLEAGE